MVDDLFDVFEDLFERRRRKGRDRDDRTVGDPDVPTPAEPQKPLFCIECGGKNPPTSRFCQECGEVLPSPGEEMRCARCNNEVPLTAKFCPNCGNRTGRTRD